MAAARVTALGAAGPRVPHTPGCSSRGRRAPGSPRGPAPPPGRPGDWAVLLSVREEGVALAPPPPWAGAGSGAAAARGGAGRPERAHWARRPAPGRGWGSSGAWAPLLGARRVGAVTGGLGAPVGAKAGGVCPHPQRVRSQACLVWGGGCRGAYEPGAVIIGQLVVGKTQIAATMESQGQRLKEDAEGDTPEPQVIPTRQSPITQQ